MSKHSNTLRILGAAGLTMSLGLSFATAQVASPTPPKSFAKPAQPQPAAQPPAAQPPAGQPTPAKPGANPTAPAQLGDPAAPKPGFNEGVKLAEAIKLEKTSHNWGIISDSAPVEYKFQFTNITEETIRVNISASCGCTVGQIEKSVLAPGETTNATAKFDPKGRSGSQTKVVTITVTDPPQKYPNASVSLSADVKALVTTEPPKLHLAEVDHRAGANGKITVTGRKEGFAITSVVPQHPSVKVKVGEPEMLSAGDEQLTKIVLDVEIEPGAPIGSLASQITINTNDERVAPTVAMISAEIVGTVRATPPSAQVRVFMPKTPFTAQVNLDSRNGTPFNIRSIAVDGRDDMGLVVDSVSIDNGRRYSITLAGTLPETPGFINGSIVVETDADGGETMRIPFTASVRPQQVARPMAPAQPKAGSAGTPPAAVPSSTLPGAATKPAPVPAPKP